MKQPNLSSLFTPFSGGGLALENRVVMAPMTRWMSPDQKPGPDVAGYYRRRAENGVGLIITEGTTVDHPVSSYSERVPAFHGEALDGWRRVVGEVHAAGGKIAPQIWHVGAMRHPDNDYPNRHLPNASPSGLFRPGGKVAGPALTRQEITEIVDSFARAAGSARELGFDAVEIHGAHGYILDQFLWDALNLRDDEYGGNAVQRTRFAVEIVEAVRAAVGPNFPVIMRVSQWKQQDYSARLADRPELLRDILMPIADAGVDIFHCSQRRYWDVEFEGSPMNLAGWVKRLTGKPTITVGSVGLAGPMSTRNVGEHAAVSTDLQPLAERIEAGEFDLVAVGRALLADASWARKVRAGQFDKLKPFGQGDLEHLS
jgi:2,4-dienoyl-CoA reductase-like NADH-dependent reductase (Old Yellow Enzyme family)